jgi:antibiotic biosynthesis monooxygenase (ABM) superfamily enzyme
MFPEHMLCVRATVEPGREAEFNRWYDNEHVPDAVRMFPGCVGAARYKVVLGDGSHQYMALYAFETAAKLSDALGGPEIKALIKIYDRDVGAFSTRVRTTYERVLLHVKT